MIRRDILPTSSRIYKISFFQLRHSPFYLDYVEVYLVLIG